MWLCTHRWLLGAGQAFVDLSAMVKGRVLQTLARKSNYVISSVRPSLMLLTLLNTSLEQVMVMVMTGGSRLLLAPSDVNNLAEYL